MPKEKINHAPEDDGGPVAWAPVAWTPTPDGEQPRAWVPDGQPLGRDAELCVGWHRDSWVQLSIEGDPSYFAMAVEHPEGDVGRTSVYTPPLTRDEINKLIRALRRAREQVFGRDE